MWYTCCSRLGVVDMMCGRLDLLLTLYCRLRMVHLVMFGLHHSPVVDNVTLDDLMDFRLRCKMC